VIPIHELLSRIHWDKQFGQRDFVIAYYDKVEDCLVRIPLREILFKPDDHSSFDLIDQNGVLHSIPMHRIREVYKEGELIWRCGRGK
jgi:uncharacterized protein (UPF0248 family)